jgi:hypothetical protein
MPTFSTLKRKRSSADDSDESSLRKQVCSTNDANDGLLLYSRREEWLRDLKSEEVRALLDGHFDVEIFQMREEVEDTSSSDLSDAKATSHDGATHSSVKTP